MSFKTELTHHALLRFQENTEKIEKCLQHLTEAEIWQRPNAASNSVGNQILHLCGNIRQYAISSLGRKPDGRKRDAEFAAAGGWSKTELIQKLKETVAEAQAIIQGLEEGEWLRLRSVQGFNYTGVGIVVHVVEHYSYHTGQIAFWTKLLRNQDLGFYADLDLNVKNQ